MKVFLLTDLEGSAGVDRFNQTSHEADPNLKHEAMKQLGREVNACIEGIRSVAADAEISVWDGHGPGGLYEQDIVGGTYSRQERMCHHLTGYDAVLFVGQHAMEGTVLAPLSHTYSPESVEYFKLNGCFIGEFGARALLAGYQGVPTIFLSGDDKAVHEAQMFIPEIETAAVKRGRGLESAIHMDQQEACHLIRERAGTAMKRIAEIPPFTGFQAPFTFEARYKMAMDRSRWQGEDVTWIDERTVQVKGNDLKRFLF